MKATHLGKVIEFFDPMLSLGQQQAEWYVERPDSPEDEISIFLLNDPAALKILFSGHIGSGKTSTLNKLMARTEIQERFFVVRFSVAQDLNIVDLTYTDLLVAIGGRLFEAGESQVGLDSKLKKDLDSWSAEISKAWGITDLAEAVVKGGIKAWFFSATGKLKTGYEEKKEFRQKIEPRVPDLIGFINRIIHAIQAHQDNQAGRRVLLVIEDLDKPPVDVALDLFLKKGSILIQPECRIIFTVPTAVLYSGQVKVVQQNFPMQFVLPNFKIKDKEGERQPEAWAKMRDVVMRRMEACLIQDAALDTAVEMSGGVVRELVRIVQGAAGRALVRKANSIATDHVNHVVERLRGEYSDSLTRDDQLEILKQVHRTHALRSNDEKPMLDLLHNLMILKYPDGPGWYGVNPIVQKLLGV
jgi:hypothetical protein